MPVNSVLDLIGNTPHVRVNKLFDPRVSVWVKLERQNPGGSVKDRIGLSMIEDAEARGVISPGPVVDIDEPKCSLHYEAVASFLAMRDAAAGSGIDLRPVSSFRDFARQMLLWNRKWAGERPLYDRAGLALDPARLTDAQVPLLAGKLVRRRRRICLSVALDGAFEDRHHSFSCRVGEAPCPGRSPSLMA